PALSTDILNTIKKKNENENNLRKAINRSIGKSGIRKLESINFENNTNFLYLSDDFNKKKYWQKLLAVLNKERNLFFHIIEAIRINCGIVSETDLRIFSASPDRMKNQSLFVDIFYNLKQSKIIEEVFSGEDVYYQLNFFIRPPNFSFKESKVNYCIKNLIIQNLEKWLVYNGLAYKESLRRANDPSHCFSHFYWSLFGLSYMLDGLIKQLKGKESKSVFIVADILQSNNVVKLSHIQYFLRKIGICRSQKDVPVFLPILIAGYFAPEALRELRSKKILATTLKNLFGVRFDKQLKDLKNYLLDIENTAQTDPEQIFDIFNNLKKDLPNIDTNNLRGSFFEYLIAILHHYKTGNSFEVGRTIKVPKTYEQAEIDILSYTKTEVFVIECKAYKSTLGISSIKHWIGQINKIKNWIHDQDLFSGKQICYQYYSLNGFDKESIQYIEKIKKYDIKLYGKEEITKEIHSWGDKSLRDNFHNFLYS
ncbi:MAG: NERD domain-containing protein, partial [Salinispira sp.]